MIDMNCPKCRFEAPECDGSYYIVEGKKYPVYSNESKYYNGSYDMHDWDETHCCPECKIEFTFSNGAV